MRLISVLFIAAGLTAAPGSWAAAKAGAKAKARRPHSTAAPVAAHSPMLSLRSPCGRHTLLVKAGSIFLDGQRVHNPGDQVEITGAPQWRSDGQAVAWLERATTGIRLVVIAHVVQARSPLFWALPGYARGEQLAWAGPHRVVVGADLLAPRAVASWTEDS